MHSYFPGYHWFIDSYSHTLNIDKTKIEKEITSRTKAILLVHYAAVEGNRNARFSLACQLNLTEIENVTQVIMIE